MNKRQYRKSKVKVLEREVEAIKLELAEVKAKLETKRKPRTTKVEE